MSRAEERRVVWAEVGAQEPGVEKVGVGGKDGSHPLLRDLCGHVESVSLCTSVTRPSSIQELEGRGYSRETRSALR